MIFKPASLVGVTFFSPFLSFLNRIFYSPVNAISSEKMGHKPLSDPFLTIANAVPTMNECSQGLMFGSGVPRKSLKTQLTTTLSRAVWGANNVTAMRLKSRSRGTHPSPAVSALTRGLTMGWPGVVSVLPTFREKRFGWVPARAFSFYGSRRRLHLSTNQECLRIVLTRTA